jgi:hypothetical protein
MLPKNRNSFLRPLKDKGFQKEIITKIGLYDLVTFTTLESNKSLIRTSYPHDTGKLRMLVHANLYRAIHYERSRALRLCQRFEQRDGPDLTTVFQPDAELTTPAQSHNMAVQQLAVFSAWARHLTTTLVSQPLTSPPAAELPGSSTAGSLAHSGRQWPGHEVAL